MSLTPKKFVDANGLTHFAENYPSNEVLGAVVDAIDDELENKVDNDDLPIKIITLTPTNNLYRDKFPIFTMDCSCTELETAFQTKTCIVKGSVQGQTTYNMLTSHHSDLEQLFADDGIYHVYNVIISCRMDIDGGVIYQQGALMTSQLYETMCILFISTSRMLPWINDSDGSWYNDVTGELDLDALKDSLDTIRAAIPTDISELSDESGALQVPTDISDLSDTNSLIPTDIGDLSDDNGLLFSGSYNDLTHKPTNISAFTNDAGYLTQHQDLTNYALLASPALTGTPTGPTAAAGTNTTQLATTAFVQSAVAASTITVDTTITQNSTNAISSGAVYAALGDIETLLEAL